MRVRRWVILMGGLGLLAALAAGPAGAAPAEESAVEKVEEGLEDVGTADGMADVYKTIAIAASVSFVTAVSIVGAGFAVGKVGSAAIGAAAEKPELLTRSLLFVALAEGLAVLGFAVAMMLLAKM
jgi:V/A-type H+-transporting ATPase subunit K